LLADVRAALADEAPLSLLALVSSLLAALHSRSTNPFERDPNRTLPSRREIVGSFLDVDAPETSALLAVIAGIDGDELQRARIDRELAARAHPLPAWVRGLADVAAYRAVEMTHVLGDADNLMIGARLPSGDELTVVVLIDHNLGVVVKDAYLVGESIADLVEHLRRAMAEDPDLSWHEICLGDAKARVTDAIARGAITFPPFETESWPGCRPLVEWIARSLPDGGTGYRRPEWDEQATQALADRFLGSPFGEGFDDSEHRQLLDSLLWFGTDYGPGDPLRWSPTAVELLLADWLPRKIIADAGYLAKAPNLLRAFIRFCHRDRDIRAELTAETLAAVDRYEPEYQQTIRSPRQQGPLALVAAIGAVGLDTPWAVPGIEDESVAEIMLDALRGDVGGEEALAQLDDQPLPDEPFDWTGIPADVRDRVGEVLQMCDRCCAELFDVEHRTACRRFLARAAGRDPAPFRRQARTDQTAAAVCWVIGKANDAFNAGGLLVKDLLAHFELAGSVSQRAATLLKAGGFPTETYGAVITASPDYLVSKRRRRIIEMRDRYHAELDNRRP
jgi:hypothetical protein